MKEQQPNSWNRRDFITSSFAVGAGAYLGFLISPPMAAAEPPPETTTLKLRVWKPACWAPIYVAETLLRAEGFTDIQYVWAPGGQKETLQILKDGGVDLSPSFSALDMFNMEKQGLPLKFLAGLHVGCYGLIGSERVKSVRDLKGKTVWTGSLENNGPHIFFKTIVAYVGLDPVEDVTYAWVSKDEAVRLFTDGKIDAFMSFAPGPQELKYKKIGRVLVDTNVDRPWSQYFCCMVSGHNEFIEKYPVATKRALRALLQGNDICHRNPELMARTLVERKVRTTAEYNYIVQAAKDIPYHKWREYDPEETIRFYALRLREVGMIKSNPQEFIAKNTDWRYLTELKNELGMTW